MLILSEAQELEKTTSKFTKGSLNTKGYKFNRDEAYER